MDERKKRFLPDRIDIEIGITILVCLIVSWLANAAGIRIEALAVTTGAVMCVQDTGRNAWKSSVIRMVGVLTGGLIGVAIVAVDNVLGMQWLFYLMVSLGVIVNLVGSRMFGLNFIQSRVSCITLLLVVMVFEGADRFEYAIGRVVGGIVGAVVALVVSVVCAALLRKRDQT